MRPILFASPFALFSLVPAHAQGAHFSPLPLGAPGTGYLEPTGVSADGQVVVGGSYLVSSGNRAQRWRNGLGFDYPGPSVGNIASWCSGLSADGTVISGGNGHAVFGDLEGWMRYGSSAGHVGSPPGHNTSDCTNVAAGGVVSVGYGGLQSNPNLFEAARYTEQGGWTNLGFLPGGNDSKATCCSADGSLVSGWSTNAQGVAAGFVWNAASGMSSIGNLPGGNQCEPHTMSFDGSVIVGIDWVGTPAHGFRWTASGGMNDLGLLPGGSGCWISGLSDDGAVATGYDDDGFTDEAVIWDSAHGLRKLRELLLAQGLGSEFSGWDFFSADCIRGTGPWYIAGIGGFGGYYEAFLVRLDSLEPAAGSSMCAGDGSAAAPCPCSNSGATGRGCANSQSGSQGALLQAFGTPAQDDVVLSASGVLPTALCIFLQGTTTLGASAAFGDGLRCVGGSLKRLASHSAVNGATSYPSAGEPSIRVRSAMLGDTLPMGALRHYQVYYRDPSASFCPAPQGGTFNISSGITIQW
ncbi:MAG: hypothetical protein IPJ19_08315 [Planctomycetes bacterium]|nr:hypothetical protein [Planctomycetota bacterium]